MVSAMQQTQPKQPNVDILLDALQEIKHADSHPMVKDGDFDLELGLLGYKADEAIRLWKQKQQ